MFRQKLHAKYKLVWLPWCAVWVSPGRPAQGDIVDLAGKLFEIKEVLGEHVSDAATSTVVDWKKYHPTVTTGAFYAVAIPRKKVKRTMSLVSAYSYNFVVIG